MRKQPRYILIEVASFVFENYQSVFAVSEQKVEKGCFRVQCIGQDQIESARIGGHDPGQQT